MGLQNNFKKIQKHVYLAQESGVDTPYNCTNLWDIDPESATISSWNNYSF